jgi:hypothetical protein
MNCAAKNEVTSLRSVMTGEHTLQETFDTIYTRLIKQGCSAVVETNENSLGIACVYRNDKGQGCAVGVLMSDEEIELARKGDVIDSHINELLATLQYTGYEDQQEIAWFLESCQQVHDSGFQSVAGDWEDKIRHGMQNVGTRFGLNTDVLILDEMAAGV